MNKKKILIYAGAAIAIGLTLELVKVPVEKEAVSVTKTRQVQSIGSSYAVPVGYTLRYNEDGTPYAHSIEYKTEVENVSLGAYLVDQIGGIFRK